MPNSSMFAGVAAEQALLEQLVQAVKTLPAVTVESHVAEPRHSGSNRRPDFEISLNIAGSPVRVLIECRKSAFPRDVRELLWQIRKYAAEKADASSAPIVVPLLMAESISTGAKELLRDEKVGYFDGGGSLYLPAPGAYVFIDKPPAKALAKSVRSIFAGRRAQVLHVLLHKPRIWMGVNEVAQYASVSPATASETLAALERFDWVESKGQGPAKVRSLTEPGALLDAWAQQLNLIKPAEARRYYVGLANVQEIQTRLALVCDRFEVTYAITVEAAAQRYAPFVSSFSQVKCRLLAGEKTQQVLSEVNARPVSEGFNLVIMESDSQGAFLFPEIVDGLRLANPVQVYLDLLRGEGRSKEMAEHLRKEKIRF